MTMSASKWIKRVCFVLLIALFIPAQTVFAQSSDQGPTYIVQPGDTLNQIAENFGVSLDDLIAANNIQDANLISAGTSLIIPGLEGVSGVLSTTTVQLGETLGALLKKYHIALDMFLKLNKVTSPAELYVGSSIIVPISAQDSTTGYFSVLSSESSLLELSARKQMNPWTIILENQTVNGWTFLPFDQVFINNDSVTALESIFSPSVSSISISPLPLIQGATIEIIVNTRTETTLTGSLSGFPLHFFSYGQGQYVALQGIEATVPIGLASLTIAGQAASGDIFAIDQMLLLEEGGFLKDPPLYVDNDTIDPAITGPEEDTIRSLTAPVTATRHWNSQWTPALDDITCIISGYGNLRSYNDSDFIYHHTGIDYGVCAPSLDIYATAPGVVVFSGDLTVRGHTIIIDHGWGVYSAYYHQASTAVNTGDTVTQGQVIGTVGATGRVTGPHLHWEIWVGGVQVNPSNWLLNTYP